MIGRVRKGSALLIVLGFMALITLSALAFSVRMRSVRIPVATTLNDECGRFLLQAGLARAMSEIDADIGERLSSGWTGRILGVGSQNITNNTNPVLTFEALAYLPPGLVESVRQMAPLAETTRWRRLDFDAGRMAFLAIDISDLPDANAVTAAHRRTSDSKGRLSLRPFFPDETAAEKFDETLASGRDAADGIPFVSLLDLNVVTGEAKKILTGEKPGSLLCCVDALPDERINGTLEQRSVVEENLDETDLQVLADYLDSDHVPSALDIPCAERVPQIGAVGWRKRKEGAPVPAVTVAFPFRPCPGLDGTFDVRLVVSAVSSDQTVAARVEMRSEIDPTSDFDRETATRTLIFELPASCLPPAKDVEGRELPPLAVTYTLTGEVTDANGEIVDRTPPLVFTAECVMGSIVSVDPLGRDVADSRINWKPEQWRVAEKSVETWEGEDCRTGCAVSDAGYLQSVTELAFLPREDGSVLDADELGLFDPDEAGPRVDPFTTTTNILLTALLATPCDWRSAATNAPTVAVGTLEDVLHVKRNALETVAGRLMDAFQKAPEENWLAAYDGLDWFGAGSGEDPFAGTALEDVLLPVDRRFLRDYWRSCFAKRQQLFLVFTRVEYGPRGVAVVARDPKPQPGGAPHRMKVLFFHIFDQRF